MVALSALGALLLAANLTSFDPSTDRPSANDMAKTIFVVRADLSGGRFASAKPVSNVTFPVADPASTVYITFDSASKAVNAVMPPKAITNFVYALIFSYSGGPRVCDAMAGSASKLNASVELQYADGSSGRTSSAKWSSASTLAAWTLQCNLKARTAAVSFRLGFTRREYMRLHPSSTMERCGDSIYPSKIDPSVNVAFTAPNGTWEQQTIADDATLFFVYKVPLSGPMLNAAAALEVPPVLTRSYVAQPPRTSILTGALFVQELVKSPNPTRFHRVARMSEPTFLLLEKVLIAIYIYSGSSSRLAPERSQHSGEKTI
ncbi:hypothetical protein SPRG_15701 [Saprolegnia parasitica CBS 223.65]|uniref:Uncharacterized protein n=1 Tax=Saprolegnia parasitica (strain CBS 223.65) TaxID=695850 RepID=A0A067BL02_SAPPC|nr:hypothetical protein SPRG_15701 [Saprolegnia parasitica CBS 223.65]KDO18873.1 hypothetical protein SPRG_15701 [Saprolegnia parasitica CBS 223.65]|eukprot:XP_012210427.1 hypothetical protein SPRG_15701 [Saprolegnia parasitica CBS 223.65]